MARVIIDRERCKGCHLCIQVCPKKILAPSKELNTRGIFPCSTEDADACIGCLQCTSMCPDAAITVIDEEKEGGGENVKRGKREDGKT